LAGDRLDADQTFQRRPLEAEGNPLVDFRHRRNFKAGEQMPHRFPQGALRPFLFPRLPEQRVASLLYLVDQERQHHQEGEHFRQVLATVSVVVFKVIALILQRVERLVLDPPADAAAARHVPNIVGGQRQIGHPRPDVRLSLRIDFDVDQQVDEQVLVAFVDAHAVEEQPVATGHGPGISLVNALHLPGLQSLFVLPEEVLVVAFLNPQDQRFHGGYKFYISKIIQIAISVLLASNWSGPRSVLRHPSNYCVVNCSKLGAQSSRQSFWPTLRQNLRCRDMWMLRIVCAWRARILRPRSRLFITRQLYFGGQFP
jgi:hypothetical protein